MRWATVACLRVLVVVGVDIGIGIDSDPDPDPDPDGRQADLDFVCDRSTPLY